ncbi:MAG: hypothetical protein ITG02_08060 [Patulibacter sp.]|nr:hypothetical protein [Patulibacter sp.]
MFPRTLKLAVPASVALGLLLPIASNAATITPLKPCYARVPTEGAEPLTFSLTGGNPNTRFLLYGVDGKASSVSGTFDAAGNASAVIPNGFGSGRSIGPSKGRTIPMEIKEYPIGAPSAVTGTAKVKVTNVAMDIDLKRRSPFSKATWKVSGLTPIVGKGTLYASYIRGTKGSKVVKRIKLGKPNACGYLRTRKVAPPARQFRTWTIYVHVGKKLDKSKSISSRLRTYKRYF